MSEPKLTDEQESQVEAWLEDTLKANMFDIARDLGLDPEGDWSDEEQDRVIAENDRRERPRIIAILFPADSS